MAGAEKPGYRGGSCCTDQRFPSAPVERLDLTHRDAVPGQLLPRRLAQPGPDGDRAGRARRGELHEADLAVDPVIVVQVKTDLQSMG